MSLLTKIGHLARRWATSLSSRPPADADLTWVDDHLAGELRTLWRRLDVADQRHSIVVARRFVERRPTATPEEIAGALLHDIGKIDSGLGTTERVLATIVGPRTERWRRYHDHERIGAELAAAAGATPATIELIRGHGPAAAALRAADDI